MNLYSFSGGIYLPSDATTEDVCDVRAESKDMLRVQLENDMCTQSLNTQNVISVFSIDSSIMISPGTVGVLKSI